MTTKYFLKFSLDTTTTCNL